MANRENVDLVPCLPTSVTFCLKCQTTEISTDGSQVTCLQNIKNPLVGNISNSSYGRSKMTKFCRFHQSRKFSKSKFRPQNRIGGPAPTGSRGPAVRTPHDSDHAECEGVSNEINMTPLIRNLSPDPLVLGPHVKR